MYFTCQQSSSLLLSLHYTTEAHAPLRLLSPRWKTLSFLHHEQRLQIHRQRARRRIRPRRIWCTLLLLNVRQIRDSRLGSQANFGSHAEFSDAQSLNLYAYVRNNPVSKTDPDGHDVVLGNTSSADRKATESRILKNVSAQEKGMFKAVKNGGLRPNPAE